MNWIALVKLPYLLLAITLSSLAVGEPVWVDVRSSAEHYLDNIEGDIRLSHDEVVQGLDRLLPDINSEIRLYCRSGGRAAKAVASLRAAGYVNVSSAGGISNARKERALAQ